MDISQITSSLEEVLAQGMAIWSLKRTSSSNKEGQEDIQYIVGKHVSDEKSISTALSRIILALSSNNVFKHVQIAEENKDDPSIDTAKLNTILSKLPTKELRKLMTASVKLGLLETRTSTIFNLPDSVLENRIDEILKVEEFKNKVTDILAELCAEVKLTAMTRHILSQLKPARDKDEKSTQNEQFVFNTIGIFFDNDNDVLDYTDLLLRLFTDKYGDSNYLKINEERLSLVCKNLSEEESFQLRKILAKVIEGHNNS